MRNYSHFSLGVLATVSVFMQTFVQATFIKSFGILLIAVRDELETSTWVLGTVFELVECINDLLAPIAGPVGKALGYRPTVMIGGVMVSAGFIAASRVSNVLHMALLLTLLTGIGYSFAHILTRAKLAQHFENRHFSLASGIGKTGVSISLFAAPPFLQLLFDTYGWRGTMLIVGSITAYLVVCGALLIPLPKWLKDKSTSGYRSLTDCQHPQQDEHEGGKLASLKSRCLNVGKAFDTSLLKNHKFWVINVIFVTGRVSKSAWIIYFVPHSVAKGFSSNTAAIVVTLAGLAHLAGTIGASVALFKEKVKSSSAVGVSIICVAVSFIVDPWTDTLWLLSANAVLFMAGIGSLLALADVMVKEELGSEGIAGAFGWIGFCSGIARISAGFLPGWIYDNTGSYDLAFVILGAMQIVALLPLGIKMLYNKYVT